MQTFEPWHPTAGIPQYLLGAVVLQPGYSELLVICDGEFSNGKCLILSFGSTDAFEVCDDAAYPNEPRALTNGDYTIPFLKVLNSEWALKAAAPYHVDSFPVHYKISSLNYSVNVLSIGEPSIRWVEPADIDALFSNILVVVNA